jgi:organic hydroperoxide reductase OsmC/OhrA
MTAKAELETVRCSPPTDCSEVKAANPENMKASYYGGLHVSNYKFFQERSEATPPSNVDVARVERVAFDEGAPRLDEFAHQGGEDRVSFDRVLDLHLE